MAANKWLKIFEKFHDGIALIKDSEVTYANQSLSELLAFKDYLGGITDIENKILKNRLETTTIERL